MSHKHHINKQSGFTLVEMAVVLAIVALLLGGLVPTLSAQMESQHIKETRKQLDEIREALEGYAIINDRLPCPASSSTSGQEDPVVVTGTCTHPHDNNSYVPAVTLGLSGTDSSGYIKDPWGNPIRYAVTEANSNAFTTANGMSTAGISSLSPNLIVCSAASSDGSSCSVSNSTLTSTAASVIYSTGKNGASGGTGTDETENPNTNSADTDRVFVYHTPTASTSTNGEFDDHMIWISPNVLVSRMVAAGKLP